MGETVVRWCGVFVAVSLAACGSTTNTKPTPVASGGAAQGGAAQGGSAGTSGGTLSAGGSMAGASAGSGGAGGSPLTPEAMCRAVIQAQCEAKTRCGVYGDITLCTQYEELCPQYYFSEGSTRTVEAFSGCLETLRNASCWEVDVDIFPACVTSGTLADGAECVYSSQCASNACAFSGLDTCKTCQHVAGSNETCDPAVGCAPGYFCDPGSNLCMPIPTAAPAAEGQPCNVTSSPYVPCGRDFTCGTTGSSATPVCYRLPGYGEPCPNGFCQSPLICHSDTTICSDFYGCLPECPAGSRCVDMAGPTCVPYAQDGEPCDDIASLCGPGLICAGGQCAPRPRRDEPCVMQECSMFLSCMNGTCVVPEPAACQ